LAEFVFLLAIGAIPVDAGIRPSFSVDRCSWNATHIVVVQTTPKDGVFSVVESRKGDLKPGDSLEVPELKPNKDAVPISSDRKPQGFGSQDTQGISEQIPRQPVGSRMILFLKKKEEGGVASPSAGNTTGPLWEPRVYPACPEEPRERRRFRSLQAQGFNSSLCPLCSHLRELCVNPALPTTVAPVLGTCVTRVLKSAVRTGHVA
jgi:hypothetical protein